MAAQRGPAQAAKLRKAENTKQSKPAKDATATTTTNSPAKEVVIEDHLAPLSLIFVILFCSGALCVLGLRDFCATGRNVLGSWDESMLLFTKSTDWFENSKGWKSTQGGFSAIQHTTTDENNMGGFFVRKMAGAAVVGVHLQKILPMLFHPDKAQWNLGHFHPLLKTAIVGNFIIAAFYGFYFEDLKNSGVFELPVFTLTVLAAETLVMLYYLATTRISKKTIAIVMPEGKQPNSVTSRIVSRTVAMVSGIVSIMAARDLLFPGLILGFIPRDDIFLEWTNAFLHSPPEGSPEAYEQGLEAPFFIGDKFVSQLLAVHILILSLYKFVTAFVVRFGNDGSGEIKCRMIWKGQFLGNAMILFLLRLFTPAARTASIDFRWHLMAFAYETFILGLYSFV